MSKILILLFSLFFFLNLSGQDMSDTISYNKSNGIYKYLQNGKELRFFDLKKTMKENPEALRYLKYANTNRSFSSFFLGSAVIGAAFSVYRYVETGEPGYLLAGAAIGGIYFVISVPLNGSFKKNTRLAIKAYNNGLNKSAYNSIKLKFGVTSSGVGFVMKF